MNNNITIGIIGLGRMGEAVAYRLSQFSDMPMICYDPSEERRALVQKNDIQITDNLHDLIEKASLIWLMVPAGSPVDDTLDTIIKNAQTPKVIVDGGNSHFKDSIQRATLLEKNGHSFLDCGTSGGLKGREIGFSLMVGGSEEVFRNYKAIFNAIGFPEGVSYMGKSGAGHYVKMIHNGIEYALLQAYAEGFHLLKEGCYNDLDLEKIAHTWNNGSVIRSWILELAEEVFHHDQELSSISGAIGENKTGQWTVELAQEEQIPVDLIERSLAIRAESRLTGGNFATKVVALLRNKFGGHPIETIR